MGIDQSLDSSHPFDVITGIAKALFVPDGGTQRAVAPSLATERPARKPGLLQRIDRWFWKQRQRDIERYLAKSVDLADLEARIQALQRATPAGFL